MDNRQQPGDVAPTPYPDLNAVLGEMVDGVRAILGRTFIGAYLQGSFAVGDYDEHSDVDWTVVVEPDLADDRVRALNSLHECLFALPSPWAQHLEGTYFPRHVLRDLARRGEPIWYLDHGSRTLERSTHDNSAVVRSVLREQAVVLAGPPPSTFIDPVPVAVLRREMRDGMATWGREILARPEAWNNRFYQGFIVLHHCRLLHDYRTGVCGSKRAAAAWAKEVLDPAWSALIDRTWDTRPDPYTSSRTPADPADFERTLAFVRYAMGMMERFAEE